MSEKEKGTSARRAAQEATRKMAGETSRKSALQKAVRHEKEDKAAKRERARTSRTARTEERTMADDGPTAVATDKGEQAEEDDMELNEGATGIEETEKEGEEETDEGEERGEGKEKNMESEGDERSEDSEDSEEFEECEEASEGESTRASLRAQRSRPARRAEPPKNIPVLEGSTPDDYETWIELLETTFRLYEVREPQRRRDVLTYALSPTHRSLVRGMNYKEAIQTLRLVCGLNQHTVVRTSQRAIQDWRWKPHDTPLSMCRDILALNQRLKEQGKAYSNAELKDMLFAQLPEPLRLMAAATVFNDSVSFQTWSQNLHLFYVQGHFAPANTPRAHTGQPRTQSNSALVANTSRQKVCWRCHQEGHLCASCPHDAATAERLKSTKTKNGHTLITVEAKPSDFALAGAGSFLAVQRAVADNGATRHVTNSTKGLRNIRAFESDNAPRLRMANKQVLVALAEGDRDVELLTTSGKRATIVLRGCLLIKGAINLVSIGQVLQEAQAESYVQTAGGAHLILPHGERVELQNQGGLIWMQHKKKEAVVNKPAKEPDEEEERTPKEGGTVAEETPHNTESALATTSVETLHCRLGHASVDKMKAVLKQNDELAKQVNKKDMEGFQCDTCLEMKATRQPARRTNTDHSSKNAGDLLVMDIAGPLRRSGAGERFALIIKDAKTCMLAVIPMKTKSAEDVCAALQALFISQKAARPEGGIPIKPGVTQIQIDNDSTFLSAGVLELLARENIHVRTSSPDSSTRQGKAESAVDRLFRDTRTLLRHAKAPPTLWAHAITHAAYLYNRMPHHSLGMRSPLEQLTPDRRPDLTRLRTFGARCYVWRSKKHRDGKLDAPAELGMYLGESQHGRGHVVRVNGHIRTSEHVTFREDTFGEDEDEQEQGDILEDADFNTNAREQDTTTPSTGVGPEEQQGGEHGTTDEDKAGATTAKADRKGIFAQMDEVRDEMDKMLAGIPVPRDGSALYGTAISSDSDDLSPTLAEAYAGPKSDAWKAAVGVEFAGLEKRRTWKQVHVSEVPQGAQIFSMVVRLTTKKDPNTGDVLRLKARACVRGYNQHLPKDVTTSSPVVQSSTTKLLLSLASALELDVMCLDFTQAYLNADLKVPVYVQPPPEIDMFPPGTVLLVTKALYGLAESGRRWHECLTMALQEMGYKQAFHDCCTYHRVQNGSPVYVGVHVDDSLCVGKREHLEELKAQLKARFDITVSDQPDTYLGCSVQRREDGAFLLTQPAKLHRLFESTGLQDANPVQTPMIPRSAVRESNDDELLNEEDHDMFRRCVGQIRHICTTYRFDVASTLNELSRHMHEPTRKHQRQLKHLIRYLKGTEEQPLVLGSSKALTLEAYCDATWNADQDEGRNISGAVFKFAGGTIECFSQRQECVTSSSTHAEMVALSTTAKQIIHFRALLEELGHPQQVTSLYTDSEASAIIATTYGTTAKTRHVKGCHFLFQQYQREGEIKVEHVKGTHQWADLLTKPLPKQKFLLCREAILGKP